MIYYTTIHAVTLLTSLSIATALVGPTTKQCMPSWQLATGPDSHTPGQGDAHQNYYYQQLSETTLCNGGECSAGRDQTQGTSIDFSLGTDSNAKPGTLSQSAIAKNPVLNLLSFFDGGFSVVESTDIGYTNDCTADAGKKAVCIWSRVAHTAYSAYPTNLEGCDNYPTDTQVFKSPNANNLGNAYQCRYDDDCKSQGAFEWDLDGCPGGPQEYCGK